VRDGLRRRLLLVLVAQRLLPLIHRLLVLLHGLLVLVKRLLVLLSGLVVLVVLARVVLLTTGLP
jgi:hypothetical protein